MKKILIIFMLFYLFFSQEGYSSIIGFNLDISNLKIKVSETDNSTIINPTDRILGLKLQGTKYKEGSYDVAYIILTDVDSKKVYLSYGDNIIKKMDGLVKFDDTYENYQLSSKYLLETQNKGYSMVYNIQGPGQWNNPNNIILNYHVPNISRYTIDISGDFSYEYFIDQKNKDLVAYIHLHNYFFSVKSDSSFPIKNAIGDWGNFNLNLNKGDYYYHEDPIDSIGNIKVSGHFHLTQFTPYVNAGEYSVNILFETQLSAITVGPTAPAPIPASLVLFGSGLVGIAGWRLRKSS